MNLFSLFSAKKKLTKDQAKALTLLLSLTTLTQTQKNALETPEKIFTLARDQQDCCTGLRTRLIKIIRQAMVDYRMVEGGPIYGFYRSTCEKMGLMANGLKYADEHSNATSLADIIDIIKEILSPVAATMTLAPKSRAEYILDKCVTYLNNKSIYACISFQYFQDLPTGYLQTALDEFFRLVPSPSSPSTAAGLR